MRGEDGSDDDSGATDRNVERKWRGEKRSNATHASTTDPDARLYRKGNNTGSCATRGTCSSRTATR